ncbi:hypothetical protein ACLOJK_037211 [Asimina triloba]
MRDQLTSNNNIALACCESAVGTSYFRGESQLRLLISEDSTSLVRQKRFDTTQPLWIFDSGLSRFAYQGAGLTRSGLFTPDYRSLPIAMAASTAATKAAALAPKPTFLLSHKPSFSPLSPNPNTTFPSSFKLPTSPSPLSFQPISSSFSNPPLAPIAAASPSPTPPTASNTFHGACYVVRDNIDTDQIIPAEHLTLVPSKPEEYRKLGSFAFSGLPSAPYPAPFIQPDQFQAKYSVVIAGANFGCGSSREHAPVALGAAGVRAVVAESYARIFFRNSVATGEVYPIESEGRLCDECTTGDIVTVELDECKLINHTTGKEYRLKPIGDAGPVVEAGGIFAYARKTGMIASK